MDDRNLMENMLMLEKGVCDLMMHGTIESACPDVKQTFSSALNSSLNMQGQIYNQMQSRGWYTADTVNNQQRSAVKMKFSQNG